MSHPLIDRYRCPDRYIVDSTTGISCGSMNGDGAGLPRRNGSPPRVDMRSPAASGPTGVKSAKMVDDTLMMPAEAQKIITKLTHEQYIANGSGSKRQTWCKDLYYLVRPLMPERLRRQLQAYYFRGWDKIPFPRWPVDVTVDTLLERLMWLSLRAAGTQAIPFIWFWPEGASSAAVLTHDIETVAGRDFCSQLMDIDEAFGFRSSFQIVPESRYVVPPAFLAEIRARGHEVNIQDLNHDGHLFRNYRVFCSRVNAINDYGREFGAKGFRSAVLYRDLRWYDQLDFEYDMSVPNVGHLDVQRGGCCTVFPYFIGRILELPVTMTQDYSLFYILRDYSLDLWKAQAALVEAKHGLLNFIVHPDYLLTERARETYRNLLNCLHAARDRGMWVSTPGELNDWWRQRAEMTLVSRDGAWQVTGPGSERARVAYASVSGETVRYSVATRAARGEAGRVHDVKH